ncbi:MAG: AEC family transporter [Solirubrobacterales bacterium]
MIWIVITMAVSGALGAAYAHRRPDTSEHFAKRLMDIVLWVIIPPVLFFNLAHFEFTIEAGKALAVGWIGNLLLVAVAFAFANRLDLSRPQVGAFVCCAVMGNTAYLGYAFSSVSLGTGALDSAIIYDIVVMLPSLVFIAFSIGAAYGTHADTPKERFKSYFTKNPLLYTAVLALLAPESLSPQWARDITHLLVYAILPAGFFAVGIVVRHESELDKLSFPPKLTKPVAIAGLLKLSFLPLFLLAMDQWITKVPKAYVLQAMMPTGLNNLLLANNYGLDRKLTTSAIIWTTLVIAVVGLVIEFV